MIAANRLGSAAFREDYGVSHAYMAGAMVKGIASADLVICMARAKLLAIYGSGGVSEEEAESQIRKIQDLIPAGSAYGVNLLADPLRPMHEMSMVDRLLQLNVRVIEASAFMEVTGALVKYRLKGVHERGGGLEVPNRVIAKVSHPGVAAAFLAPPSPEIVQSLLSQHYITEEEAALAPRIPVASDLTVEADSGGHTDRGVTSTLLPVMIALRNAGQAEHGFAQPSRVGSAGGIGTPQAAASAFLLGADYIATGSINQCTPEAGTSEAVKDMLQRAGVQDTAYAPAGDMFEIGAKVQVLKKGSLFPARGNKLYELWRSHSGLETLPGVTRKEIEDKYLRRSFEQVYEETCSYYEQAAPEEIERAERNPKSKMALIFRWYFVHSMRLALAGEINQKTDWQVYCGPALGAFNAHVAGTGLENWHNRHVDQIGLNLMEQTASYLGEQINALRHSGMIPS
jgi:trans-AT polyketide synthase, acyltransferase and oxidoreductase domains